MTELRNVEVDLARFRSRVFVASLAVVLAFGLVAARMVYLQVLRHDAHSGEKTLLLSTGPQTHPRDWREAQLLHEEAVDGGGVGEGKDEQLLRLLRSTAGARAVFHNQCLAIRLRGKAIGHQAR